MNLDEINKIYTKAVDSDRSKRVDLGKKLFEKKVLPKIKKAAAAGENYIKIYTCRFKNYSNLYSYISNLGTLKVKDSYDAPIFFYGLIIEGWRYAQPEPNDILKDNI